MKKVLCAFLVVLSVYGQTKAQGGWTPGSTTVGTTTFNTTSTNSFVGIGTTWTHYTFGAQTRIQSSGENADMNALRHISGAENKFSAIQLGRLPVTAAGGQLDFALAVVANNGTFASNATPGDVVFRAWTGNILLNSGVDNTVLFLKGTKSADAANPVYGSLVGIGNTNPVSKLDLSYQGTVASADLMSNATTGAPNKLCLWRGNGIYYGFGTTANTVNYFSGANHNFYAQSSSAAARTLVGFMSSQGMGVNVSTIPAGYHLAVGGKIIAKELKITATTIPDYVFSPAYRLPPLGEVAAYIEQNGHLPEVPSAVEVAREGINVSEMQATLLKKVEELTLYMIEQNRQLQNQQQQIEQLKVENRQRHGRRRKQ